MDDVRLGFISDKNPLEGVLTFEHPQHTPYTAHVSIAKTQSRKRYAKEAAESRGLDRELVERILADLCTTKFAEIVTAAESEEEADDSEGQTPEVSEKESTRVSVGLGSSRVS